MKIMLRIVADDKIPFLKGAFDNIADITYLPGSSISPKDIKNADALLVRTRTKCNASLLNESAVSFIATATIGFDHIDTEYCRKHDIFWTNAPGCNSSSVEQYFVAAMLNLSVRLNLKFSELCIGIIGVGNVGKKIARVAEILGMKVLLNDPPRAFKEGIDNFESLEKIKNEADIISFHVPLNVDGPFKTLGMADKSFFSGLKKKVILLNTSRGEVINEADLMSAIIENRFRALVLDVWNNEPSINTNLLKHTTIATPHIAGYSTDGKAMGTMMSVQALSRYFDLGLDNWSPRDIPFPEVAIISIDCSSKSENEILNEAFMQTYNILEDDSNLRSDVSKFEALRGTYRIRREPHAYGLKLLNNSWPGLEEKFEMLGFSVLAPNCFCEI